jgi:hypothetical protein
MSPRARRQVSDASLIAGARVDRAFRTVAQRMSTPTLIGAGLLAAGALAALAHLTGADMRAGLAGAQPTLFADLFGPKDGSG